jgi:hypothetical protein
MARGRRLRHPQDFYHVAHADFTFLQEVENAQTRPIGKRSKHQINVFRSHNLYSPRRIIRHLDLPGQKQCDGGELFWS